jgi:hypothetical protein
MPAPPTPAYIEQTSGGNSWGACIRRPYCGTFHLNREMGSKPQSQSPTGSKKKPRKPRCSPQVISPATWEVVKSACIAGMGFSEAARTFGINNAHTVIMKSRAQHWPIPSRVQERVCQLQRHLQRQSETAQEERNGNDQALEAAAQSWAEKGEAHRQLAFQIATSELKKIAHAPPPVESWRDVDFLDRIGRRSAGLDDSERSQNINIGMQMVEFRLANISLPPDAPDASGNPFLANGQDVTKPL